MLGGMVWMLKQGATPKEMFRFGVACGTSATMNAGSELFKNENVLEIYR